MVLAISMATLTTVAVIVPLVFMGTDQNVRASLTALGMPLSVALIGSLASCFEDLGEDTSCRAIVL